MILLFCAELTPFWAKGEAVRLALESGELEVSPGKLKIELVTGGHFTRIVNAGSIHNNTLYITPQFMNSL